MYGKLGINAVLFPSPRKSRKAYKQGQKKKEKEAKQKKSNESRLPPKNLLLCL
jgi:hypothetical protein